MGVYATRHVLPHMLQGTHNKSRISAWRAPLGERNEDRWKYAEAATVTVLSPTNAANARQRACSVRSASVSIAPIMATAPCNAPRRAGRGLPSAYRGSRLKSHPGAQRRTTRQPPARSLLLLEPLCENPPKKEVDSFRSISSAVRSSRPQDDV